MLIDHHAFILFEVAVLIEQPPGGARCALKRQAMLFHVSAAGSGALTLRPCAGVPPGHVPHPDHAEFTLYLAATPGPVRAQRPFVGLVWGDVIIDVADEATFRRVLAEPWQCWRSAPAAPEKRNVRRRGPPCKPADEADTDVECSESAAEDGEDGEESSVEAEEDYESVEEEDEEEPAADAAPSVLSEAESDDDE